MLKFYIKVFYVMGKALSGELACPCDRSCGWNYAPLKLLGGKLCLLNNSETLRDISTRLGTNIKHHQTMFREQEPLLLLHF